jgi:hypothetical protein
VNDQDSKLTLNMPVKVATDLHSEAKAKLAAKMKAKIEAEEAKQVARRAEQEKQLAYRAEKKQVYQEAKAAEAAVAVACGEYEVAQKSRLGMAKDMASVQAAVQLAAQKVVDIRKKLEHAQEKLETALKAEDEVRSSADATIVEQKSQNLREAWGNSQAAWDRIQKGIRKRPAPEGKDRALAKRVKGLLG